VDEQEVRLSDSERDQVVNQLQAASADGRITLEEFSERSRLAYKAQFPSELVPLTVDLPATTTPATAPLTPTRPAPSAAPPRKTRWLVQVMGGSNRAARWDDPERPVTSVTVMGGQVIDLTGVDADRVTITALTLMGGTEIIVPTGASVDVSGFMLFGGIDGTTSPSTPDGMRVEVRAWGAMGGCQVRNLTQKEIARRRR